MKYFLTLLLLCLIGSLVGQSNGKIKDELLVRLEDKASIQPFLQKINARHPASVTLQRTVARQHGIFLLKINTTIWQENTLEQWLQQQPEVMAFQYNYQLDFRQEPNDFEFVNQWGFPRIGIEAVWDVTTGGQTSNGDQIVIAVLDSGFDIEHPDLAANVWQNSDEIPNDGLDNDNNGYIDDTFGWNFKEDSNEMLVDDHGLAVAGILGASGNNSIGVAGINWNVKVMLFATGFVDQIISAYEYCIEQRKRYNESNGQKGAFLVATNASFGLPTPTFCEAQPVWGGMYDLMGEVGILTGAGTANSNVNVDLQGDMPTSCESDFILTVTNVTQDDEKYQSSGFGKKHIDMGAPGHNSYSLALSNQYGSFNGNSAAAPHLTGSIALLYALPCQDLADGALTDPMETALFIREAIINNTEPLADLDGITVTGGILNVENAMNFIGETCVAKVGPLDLIRLYPNPSPGNLTVEYETPDYETYEFRIYNILGQEVYRHEAMPNRFAQKKLDLDLQFLAKGSYFFMIQRNDDRVIKPFVIF
ncbi:MAG TPA: S8/S53 family peptidase [Saprospiraceae bacterium]|nr:S8/S53 family peptidase [Saprospiraceae bacterium]HMQ83139.1 S8/S53 family peptidase [Saprospiraceae bacterium]